MNRSGKSGYELDQARGVPNAVVRAGPPAPNPGFLNEICLHTVSVHRMQSSHPHSGNVVVVDDVIVVVVTVVVVTLVVVLV